MATQVQLGTPAMTIMKRGNTFHLRKRVPARYQPIEDRKSVWVSLSSPT